MTLPANARIIDLPAGTTPTGAEPIETVQNGISVQLTQAQIVSVISAPALTVKGNPTNAVAPVQDVAGSADQVLRVNSAGISWSWGQVNLGSAAAVSGTLLEVNGGTGKATYTLGDTLYADSGTTLAKLAGNITTTRRFLRQTGSGAASAAPAWDTIGTADVPAPGSDTQMLFNDGGALGADAGFVYAKATDRAGLAGGLRVGFAGVASADDLIEVGDANLKLDFNAGNPLIGVDTGDYFSYARVTNTFVWGIGAADIAYLTGGAFLPAVNGGLALGGGLNGWAGAFFASGAQLNFGNGNTTIAHSANRLDFAGAHIHVTHTGADVFGVTNTTDNATVHVAHFEGDRATPTVGDNAHLSFYLSNSAGTQIEYAHQRWQALNITPGAEEGALIWRIQVAGAVTSKLQLEGASLRPVTNDTLALGTATTSFSDLFLASGGVINWANGDVGITHSADTLAFAGGTGYTFDSFVRPASNDGATLGVGTLAWSDLFLASGGVINFNNGNITGTHSNLTLTWASNNTAAAWLWQSTSGSKIILDNQASGNTGWEIGRTDNVASLCFFDFHTGTDGTNDYDSRILASGGTAADGGGTINFEAASLSWSSNRIDTRADWATAANYRANTADKILITDDVWSAADLVALTDGANIAVNMANGFNFSVTLAGNRTLDNPTNTKNGQTGVIIVTQDGTGTRTLAYGTNWEFAGGTAPTLSTGANAKDVLFYFVQSSTSIIITGIIKAVA